MTESPCSNYTPWTDHGLQITQCLEFWEGQCGESLSPHYKQDCPWKNGYPCLVNTGEGRWKAPLKMSNSTLSGPVGINVARLLGIELPPMEPHPNQEPDESLAQRVGELDKAVKD